jgi:ABC-type Fe3+-hydroxamate transport system substrate-binding protein
MPVFTDQIKRTADIPDSPQRIISLVPSITELLYDLELANETAGITRFCVHPPEWFRTRKRIGGTKDINIEMIRQISPDLVLASKEENNREQVEQIARDYPVWVSDVKNLQDAVEMIRSIGEITDRVLKADEIVRRIVSGFERLDKEFPIPTRKAAYFIWKKPYMAAGTGTFIHDMMKHCGIANVYSSQIRYPAVDFEWIKESGCELILLSSEPYPFREKHQKELEKMLPQTQVLLVDGTYFSWYGSRLIQSPAYFASLRTMITP